MPTINNLSPAQAVSDSDQLAIWQNGTTVQATRAQFLAGVEPQIELPAGSLAGRVSNAPGDIEPVIVGANLALAAGTLSAATPFSIAALGAGAMPQSNDRVAILQNGSPASIDFATLAAGLSTQGEIDISQFVVHPTAGLGERSLAELFSDAISIESFGAQGDGVTDDTAAFQAAVLSGYAVRLRSATYIVNGQLSLTNNIAIIGVGPTSRISRTSGNYTGPWISVSAPSISISGVQFDAAALPVGDTPVLLILPSCLQALLTQVGVSNGRGASTGHGLQILSKAGAHHIIRNGGSIGNSGHGVCITGAGMVVMDGHLSSGNGSSGIDIGVGIDFLIQNSSFVSNITGISIEGGGAIRSSAPNTGRVIGNSCYDNTAWGISSLAGGITISGNRCATNGQVATGGGMLVQGSGNLVLGNTITSVSTGIDGRGAVASGFINNTISGGTAILVGGGERIVIRGNLIGPVYNGVRVTAIEPMLSTTPTNGVDIDTNIVLLSASTGSGIEVLDGAQAISVTNNGLFGIGPAVSSQALWLHTDEAVVYGNRWNGCGRPELQTAMNAGQTAIVVPDYADGVLVTSAAAPVQMVVTEHQLATLGQITFIRVTAGGTGYTNAHVQITGSGTGAEAAAVVAKGQVVWIAVTNAGSGYGALGANAQVVITGDGVGATASAFVGLPVTEGRRLRIACSTAMTLAVAQAAVNLQSWSGAAVAVPAFGAIELEGIFGTWAITGGPPVGYIDPTAGGGLTVRSLSNAALTLQPGGDGPLVIASDNYPAGYTSSLGHGAPTGVVVASPGSDYRNLDGGIGATLWIKQIGSDAQGWVAIA